LGDVKILLRAGTDVTRAIHAAGYGSSSGFYARARAELGMTPSSYRRGGEGMDIAFATSNSPVGQLLVAATARGVCAVSIGEDAATLETALREEYPRATVRRDEAAVRPYVDAVRAHLQDRTPLPALPVDVSGTPFQRRVWHALRGIPAGERRSYGEVAAALGTPRAARAVARACAANRAAIVIPCHRVVRGDGEIGGYRWGDARKEALLAGEGDMASR
jgi:AraC family transcriptional regulator of adaptative response/methylated-DNA-[protein]-cysteine methyltransferase